MTDKDQKDESLDQITDENQNDELLSEIDEGGILHDEEMYTGDNDTAEDDADASALMKDIEHHPDEEGDVDAESGNTSGSLLAGGDEDDDDNFDDLLDELEEDDEHDKDSADQELNEELGEAGADEGEAGESGEADSDAGESDADEGEAGESGESNADEGEAGEAGADEGEDDDAAEAETLVDKIKQFAQAKKAELIAVGAVAAVGLPAFYMILAPMFAVIPSDDAVVVQQASYMSDLESQARQPTIKPTAPKQEPAPTEKTNAESAGQQFRQPVQQVANAPQNSVSQQGEAGRDYNYSEAPLTQGTVNPPPVTTVQPTAEMKAAFDQERKYYEMEMRRIEADRRREQEQAQRREREQMERLAMLESRIASQANGEAKGGSISDTTMINKNTEVIMRLAERQQRYEETLNQIGSTLNDMKRTQEALRKSLDQQSARLDENQKAISTIANSVIDLRNTATSGRSIPQQLPAQQPKAPVRPSYKIVSASHGVAFVQSNKRPGQIVRLEVGDALSGYGRITGIDGYGNIMTTAGRVKTR